MILFANNSTGSALTLIYLLMGDLTVSYKFFSAPQNHLQQDNQTTYQYDFGINQNRNPL